MVSNLGNYAIHPIPLCVIENFPRTERHWKLRIPSEETIAECNYTWYIEGPHENYLVDAGMESERFSTGKYRIRHIQTLDEGLGKLGLTVDDIDYVIVTHTHHDHIANLRRFTRAKAIVQRVELEEALNPFEYIRPRLPKDYFDLLEGVQWEVVEGDTKIDENIELIFTPGHSPGGQSVAVKTSQGLAIIAGFDSIRENFEPPEDIRKKGYPFTISSTLTNPIEFYESTKKIIGLADIIIPIHEYEALKDISRIG